jgi:hypothetical protein
MRRERKLFYWIEPVKIGYYWCPSIRKWVIPEETTKSIVSSCDCDTFDKAMKVAKKVPTGEVRITQFCWKKGHRVSRNYYYRRGKE